MYETIKDTERNERLQFSMLVKNEVYYFFKTGLHVFSALALNFSALDEGVDKEMQETSDTCP
jgi:hypothetical protein